MKAISLWQPWASAIAIGAKKIETRHWSTSYRGPLAIHAAKKKDCLDTIYEAGIFKAFSEAGINTTSDLPLGAIVATCVLTKSRPTDLLRNGISPLERALGGYEDGRFGWVLENVVWLKKPIPFRGAQGFFNVPDSLLEEALA